MFAFGIFRLKALRDIKNGKTDTINYTYDVNGHLKERIFPNGTGTTYDYYPGGLLKSLTSTDSKGILDKYEYTYNEKGNRTSITRQRRDLENISGTYAYSYDDLGRLTESTRNGNLQSAYTYDAFGNRTKEISEGVETIYSYDVLDRLIKKEVSGNSHNSEVISEIDPVVTTYGYDRRGNLTAEYEEEVLIKSYSYNMQNLLEKSVIRNTEVDIQTVTYAYNYFGQRIRKTNGIEEVRYLTDITRDHYNLLSQSINGKTMTFTYDHNVGSFEREGIRNYYQLDELGSTMYLTGTDGAAYSPKAYDPFGNILDPVTGKRKTKRPIQSISYTKEGNLIQPFAFTGYREEENGLYYAQARSYDPQTGRFISEDKVSGLLTMPDTVNHYIYCFNDPTVYVDNNGLWGKILSNIANAVGEVASTAVNGITSAVDYAVKHPVGTIAAIGTGALVATAVVVAAPVVLGGLATAAVAAGVSSTVVGAVGATATFAVAGAAGAIAGDFVKQDYEINYYHERDEFDVNELKAAGVGGFVSGAAIGFATYGAGMAAIGSASNLYGPLSVSTAIKGMSSAVTLPTVAFSGFMGSSASSGYYQYETTGTINPYQTIGDGLAGGYMSAVT
jgi:RHS repeat-associated protein